MCFCTDLIVSLKNQKKNLFTLDPQHQSIYHLDPKFFLTSTKFVDSEKILFWILRVIYLRISLWKNLSFFLKQNFSRFIFRSCSKDLLFGESLDEGEKQHRTKIMSYLFLQSSLLSRWNNVKCLTTTSYEMILEIYRKHFFRVFM